jgi:hypothetical protein
MCGVVGVFSFGEMTGKKEELRKESMIFLGSELLQLTQPRGKDATGAIALYEDGFYNGIKMGVPALELLSKFGETEKDYGGFVKIWRKNKAKAKAFIGHCRNGTKGGEWDNDNNHPIVVEDVIGVHNGVINNDKTIFEKLKCERTGEVDSEAVFRLIHRLSNNGKEPFTAKMIQEVVNRLDGSFCVISASGNNPNQVCAFRDGRPLELMLIRPLGIVACASEKNYLGHALFRYNKVASFYSNPKNLVKFPEIKSCDLDQEKMTDDSCLIFDLTVDVTKDTDLKDLYDYEKMSRCDKIWTGASKVKRGRNYSCGHGSPIATVAPDRKGSSCKKSEEERSPVLSGESAGVKKTAGRVWNNKDKKYNEVDPIDVDKKKETDAMKSATLSVDGSGGGERKYVLKETSSIKAGKNEAAVVEVRSSDEKKDRETKVGKSCEDFQTVEVDARVDSEALGAAENFSKTLKMFESEEEIVESVGVKDVETLRSIPPQSLANRITKQLFKEAFYKGYLVGKNGEDFETTGKNVERKTARKKELSAHRKIQLLKMFLKAAVSSGGEEVVKSMEEAVIKRKARGDGINEEDVHSIINSGDSNDLEVLKKVVRKQVS